MLVVSNFAVHFNLLGILLKVHILGQQVWHVG